MRRSTRHHARLVAAVEWSGVVAESGADRCDRDLATFRRGAHKDDHGVEGVEPQVVRTPPRDVLRLYTGGQQDRCLQRVATFLSQRVAPNRPLRQIALLELVEDQRIRRYCSTGQE